MLVRGQPFHAEDSASSFPPNIPPEQTFITSWPNPTILGVTFDQIFQIRKDVDNNIKKAKPIVRILRLLCCTS